jgi:hypothetical protein
MSGLILAICNLLATLALGGVVWWNVRRTEAALTQAPSHVVQRLLEIEAEWHSTLDLLTKQQKKLSKRAKDASADALEAPPSLDLASGDPHQAKQAYRALARQRGLMR